MPSIPRLILERAEALAFRSLARGLIRSDWTKPAEHDLRRLATAARELPRPVLDALLDFRLTGRPSGGFVISGLPLNDDAVGPTPLAMGEPPSAEVAYADTALLLLASALGHPFSYAAVQSGNLIVDVLPVPGSEETQLGTSSSVTLEWHVEEAFDELRSDWLLLLCLRNEQRVPTTFARLDDVELAPEVLSALFEPEYVITRYSPDDGDPIEGTAKKIAVLSGDPEFPFLRIDPAFMSRRLPDARAEEALSTVIDGLEASLQDVVLQPGDVLVIDNFRAVHGRRQFSAQYDGRDRWLRLANVTADLRKSEGRRSGVHGRTLKT